MPDATPPRRAPTASSDLALLRAALARVTSATLDEGDGTEALAGLIRTLRGKRRDSPRAVQHRLALLNGVLAADGAARAGLARYFGRVLGERDCAAALAESGVPVVEGFVEGTMRRVAHAVLPLAHEPTDLRKLVRQVFEPDDACWVERVARSGDLAKFVGLVLGEWAWAGAVWPDLSKAIRVLGYRVAGLGLESEVASRLPDKGDMKAAFLELNPAIEVYLTRAARGAEADPSAVREALARCEVLTRFVRMFHGVHGTSLRLTALTWRLRLQIRRLRMLVLASSREGDAPQLARSVAEMAGEIVVAELRATSVGAYLRDTTRLLALEVTAHDAHHGAEYVMSTRGEYVRFFWKSAAAGLFVSAAAVIKLLLPHHLPPFWNALVYSLNYVACFVLIYLTGSALATKQPAMTASHVAQSIDESESDEVSVANLAQLVRRVIHSQLISFAGNLVVVFPLGFLLAYLARKSAGYALTSPDEAWHILEGLHPLKSGSLLFAAVAGVWLFVTGLLTGYVDNHVRFGRVAQRLEEHPVLGRALSPAARTRLGGLIERHAGGVLGNVAFGMLMGSTALVAGFFGLGLDVRHITFSAAHFGVSLEVLGRDAGARTIATVGCTVLLIGFVNFCVSFGLALVTAMKARGLGVEQLRMVGWPSPPGVGESLASPSPDRPGEGHSVQRVT